MPQYLFIVRLRWCRVEFRCSVVYSHRPGRHS